MTLCFVAEAMDNLTIQLFLHELRITLEAPPPERSAMYEQEQLDQERRKQEGSQVRLEELEAFVQSDILDNPEIESLGLPSSVEKSIYVNALRLVLNMIGILMETTKIKVFDGMVQARLLPMSVLNEQAEVRKMEEAARKKAAKARKEDQAKAASGLGCCRPPKERND